FPVLVVQYTTAGKPPWLLGKLQAQPPSIDLPVLASSWKVWLPPGLEVANSNGNSTATLSWEQRLFGPLARNKDRSASTPSSTTGVNFEERNLPAELLSKLFLSALGDVIPNTTVP